MSRLWVVIAMTFMLGCDDTAGEGQEVAERVATAWGQAYFNYDFQRAAKYVTSESNRWLSFAASNIYQSDVDLLREQEEGVSVEVDDYCELDDSTAEVILTVRNFLQRDTIGRAGRFIDEAGYRVTVVRREGRSMVRMEGLPRSEKHSRD
ncbi:MAG: hypothetical protein IJP74_07165 [Prevotella sp.]|nr:hypothetical protein [Prevotella sp.]